MLTFERLPLDQVDFRSLDGFDDRTFSQRLPWLEFITSFTGGEIVIAALSHHGNAIGYFSGVLVRKLGMIPILGSPFRGWTTAYMGFNLPPDFPRADALKALERFAFGELGCLHLEVTDRYLVAVDAASLGFAQRPVQSYLSDLTRTDDEIFADMTSACRRAIRKAHKSGLTVEEAGPENFADEYHEQLRDVFAKQSLTPTYSCDRVRTLIDHVHPSGDLLLARVREPGGQSIATGIYPGFGRFGFFWGNGSLRQYQILRPNEALMWFALRYWRDRGMRYFDWGGAGAAGTYKAKYGGTPFALAAFRKSRYTFIQYARDTAERAYYFPRQLRRARYQKKIGA